LFVVELVQQNGCLAPCLKRVQHIGVNRVNDFHVCQSTPNLVFLRAGASLVAWSLGRQAPIAQLKGIILCV
jgi:hypothetical protein